MKLGLIGCGKMGSALLKGIMKSDSRIEALIFDSYAPSAEELSTASSAAVADNIDSLVSVCEVILLCVKPNDVSDAVTATAQWEGKLLLSIAAGVTTEALNDYSGGVAKIIRVMPNTPALIGQGASAFCRGKSAKEADAKIAKDLLSCVGTVSEVKESLMDAVTGLSGSGPAYVYTIVEALSDAGVKQGLPRDIALQLACQTVKGATAMVQESGLHPSELRDQVTSPGGTTIAGLAALEEKGLRHALISAVDAATKRSQELG